jgi:hypothetical protein
MRLAGALAVTVLAVLPALADGGSQQAPTCLSYREAKARWPGAYMTWRYDSRKWQCWAPKGAGQGWARLGKAGQTPKNQSRVDLKNAHNPHILRTSDDIAPEFPQPEAVRVEQIPWPHPGGLGWVWEAKEPFQPQRIGDDPEPVYSTFDGEPPDVWPAQSKTAGSGLPTVLLLALLAGGGLMTTTAGLWAIRWRP